MEYGGREGIPSVSGPGQEAVSNRRRRRETSIYGAGYQNRKSRRVMVLFGDRRCCGGRAVFFVAHLSSYESTDAPQAMLTCTRERTDSG